MNNRVNVEAAASSMMNAAARIFGPYPSQTLWNGEQVFELCRECNTPTHSLDRCRTTDITALCVITNGAPAIYYNPALTEDQIRVHVLGELAVALTMRLESGRCRRFPEYAASVGETMRRRVSMAVSLMGQPSSPVEAATFVS